DDDDEDEDELTQRYLTIEEIYAISGMRVSKGDPLLKFSEDSIESVRKLLQSALADAKQEYNDAEKEYNLSALEAKTSLEKREVAKKYAAKIYKGKIKDVSNNISSMQVQLESDQAKVESLQEKIDSAYEKYVEANDTYTASKEYYEALVEGNSSLVISYMNTYLNAKNSYEKALETYENAVEALDKNNAEIASLKTNIYNSKASKLIETLALKADYDEAFLYGDYAELAYQAAIEDLKETLNEAKEDKETYEEKLEAFEALVGTDGILYAEEDGIITESNYSAGDELERTGSLFSYATDKDLSIAIDVTEEDVVYISVGEEVTVEFSAYPGEEYKGIITSINTTATSAGTPTVSYEVVVKIDGSLDKLFGGMTAKITFTTEFSDNTVYIDRKALVEEKGSYYVYKKTGLSGKELTPVTIGIKNESYVEILSGITEQDTVYIPTLVNGKADK
ncbi:MAG: efflux RND transporter periplasmic adaptor subunit, partial [Lachnospiraceae bacterium]|nr:efflux RND transporter periplasmic adaptor subunit [Lachnospiraceae bacterium]